MSIDQNKIQRKMSPEKWVEEHGDALYRYALLQLRDVRASEEVVQETFVSALQSMERFQGRSSERSWLIGILKHKIIDYFRKASRERPAEDIDQFRNEIDDLFDETGHWKPEKVPGKWNADAKKALEKKEFWEIFQKCLTLLPERTASAFMLKEVEEIKGEEVCKVLNISATNLWVMLHRARLQLRKCLETRWFDEGKKGGRS